MGKLLLTYFIGGGTETQEIPPISLRDAPIPGLNREIYYTTSRPRSNPRSLIHPPPK